MLWRVMARTRGGQSKTEMLRGGSIPTDRRRNCSVGGAPRYPESGAQYPSKCGMVARGGILQISIPKTEGTRNKQGESKMARKKRRRINRRRGAGETRELRKSWMWIE